jgi:hypothetical protein
MFGPGVTRRFLTLACSDLRLQSQALMKTFALVAREVWKTDLNVSVPADAEAEGAAATLPGDGGPSGSEYQTRLTT